MTWQLIETIQARDNKTDFIIEKQIARHFVY